MMFKTTTVVALVAALVPSTHAAAMDTASTLEARQEPCPVNGNSCGWYLLNRAQPCMFSAVLLLLATFADQTLPLCTGTTQEVLRGLNSSADPWNSIWEIKASKPVAFVTECRTGCSQQGTGRPNTVCN
jgi:hypothetical protein